jgi:hypothetical protein
MADRQPSMKAGTARILSELRRVFSTTPASPNTALFSALRLLAKWRAEELKAPAIAATGGMVAGGPFAGMRFEDGATEGCFLPKLLGCYEAELHAYWTGLRRDRHYRTIVDIGAAEGYYVVGLARMFPEARLIARDTNPAVQPFLDRLATANGVRDRIEIGGEFGHADFAAYADQPTLVVCDIEGGERELLDPAKAPALGRFDIVVEVHEGKGTDFCDELARRFVATHDVTKVPELPRTVIFPHRYQPPDQLDRMISMWEFRSTPTPWLVMRARDFPPRLAG